jgi:hypothetical protein
MFHLESAIYNNNFMEEWQKQANGKKWNNVNGRAYL